MKWTDFSTIEDLVQSIKTGQISVISIVEEVFKRIQQTRDFQVLLEDFEQEALKQAKIIDDKVRLKQPLGRLAGVPFIVKDNFLTFSQKTTAASHMLEKFIAPYQATSVNKLIDEDAILVGKANLDAYAHGSSTENSDFFTTKNPYDKNRVPGGSSGGSAAAVALNLVPFALGTDTGGSIRLPASFCNQVGLKPSYGLVSRSGVVAMASSLDCIGPITKNVQDNALILDIIADQDQLDSTTIKRDKTGYLIDSNSQRMVEKAKIGVISDYLIDGIDQKVKTNFLAKVELLKQAGFQVEDISIPLIKYALAVYYIICPAEISSNLSRYDGLRYGYHQAGADNIETSVEMSRSKGFGQEAKRRIMIGTYVLSSGYYDAYYKKAQQVRTKLINSFAELFKSYDFLVGPTVPTLPFKIGEKKSDPVEMYLTDVMTVSANLVGIPAISLPAGMIDGLPTGFQVMANIASDKQLLAFSSKIEELLK